MLFRRLLGLLCPPLHPPLHPLCVPCLRSWAEPEPPSLGSSSEVSQGSPNHLGTISAPLLPTGCTYMGRIFYNNETFPSVLDPCLSCICLVRAAPGITKCIFRLLPRGLSPSFFLRCRKKLPGVSGLPPLPQPTPAGANARPSRVSPVSRSWARWPARPWTVPSSAPTPSTPRASAALSVTVGAGKGGGGGPGGPVPPPGDPHHHHHLLSAASLPADCNYQGRKVVNGQTFTPEGQPCTRCTCQVSGVPVGCPCRWQRGWRRVAHPDFCPSLPAWRGELREEAVSPLLRRARRTAPCLLPALPR